MLYQIHWDHCSISHLVIQTDFLVKIYSGHFCATFFTLYQKQDRIQT